MKIREDFLDEVFMEVIDILGKNFDTTLDNATNVAEQITELVNDKIEEDAI